MNKQDILYFLSGRVADSVAGLIGVALNLVSRASNVSCSFGSGVCSNELYILYKERHRAMVDSGAVIPDGMLVAINAFCDAGAVLLRDACVSCDGRVIFLWKNPQGVIIAMVIK